MIPIINELIRVQILFELYEHFFRICNYAEIERQRYRICPENKCEVVAGLYYLNDRNLITVRTTDQEDVFIIFIRFRGVDDIEARLRRTNTIILANSCGPILIPDFSDVPY
jgi:hypothetical protein